MRWLAAAMTLTLLSPPVLHAVTEEELRQYDQDVREMYAPATPVDEAEFYSRMMGEAATLERYTDFLETEAGGLDDEKEFKPLRQTGKNFKN